MANGYEGNVRKLIAYDNMNIPLGALNRRIARRHKDLAVNLEEPVDQGADFGCAIADVEYRDKNKARALRDAVNAFCEEFPREGRKLQQYIAVKRVERETYLQYGLPEGRKLSSADYVQAMVDVGLTESQARVLYPAVLDTSRVLQRARGKKTTTTGIREVLIGRTDVSP